MRAIVLRETGGPDVLKLETVNDPTPGQGQVLVRVDAAALNHRDVFIRQGLYAGMKLPVIPGSDCAGEVVAVGDGVDESMLGWRVVVDPALDWGRDARVQGKDFRILGMPEDGTYAQFVRVPASNVHAAPSALSVEEAAALPLAGLTAFRAVVSRGQTQVDENVLVTGVGGGVATFAVQMARYAGARVFVTSSSDAKLARAQEFGAQGGANYKDPAWLQRIRDLTDGGPDLVIDGAGGAQFEQLLDLVRPGGRIVTYGATLGPVPEVQIRRIFWKQLTIMGSTMGMPGEFVEMLKWFETGAISPIVDCVYPLAEAAEAHRRLEAAGQFGKIVLKP
ncbi:MAG: ccr [Cyanobacteria bacterium RYN_339]|nr:ccr [Cyanobacteria bacterium RYN_339]